VTENTSYVHPINFLAPGSGDMHDTNNNAVDYLFRTLCKPEFNRVCAKVLACKIWEKLKVAHGGNNQVKALLFATYWMEYENFTHLPRVSIDSMFQRLTMLVNNMRANMTMLPYDDHDRAMKVLHSLDRTIWGTKAEAILESGKYEMLTVDVLFSKLKSFEVDRGVRGKIENLTHPHSLALVFGPRTNANLSTRQFSLSVPISVPDEEFDVLGEEDLALLSRMFEKNSRRNLGMCYKCGKHRHFIAECLEAMENKIEHKHRPRTEHKHRSRNGYDNKNKSERRLRKSGGHKKKMERAMVAGVRDIDLSSNYTSLSSSCVEEEVDRYKSKRSSNNINDLCFTTQGFCGMAHSSRRNKSKKDDSNSDFEDEVNNDPAFSVEENARLNELLDNRDDVLGKTNNDKREYRTLQGEAKEMIV
jgi:hypothetical protein